jgi:phage terminase large subunit
MTPIQIPVNYTPRDYQLPVWKAFDNGFRKFFLVWPRQIGKDTTCWAIMCRQAFQIPGNYFYIFPTQKQAKSSLWIKVLEDGTKLLNLIGLDQNVTINGKPIVTRISHQEMTMELYNGSTITILGLDANADAARGITPTGVVFSEFAFSDEEGYKAVLPALRREGCWRIINSTPNGRNHFHRMYTGVKGEKDWFVSEYQALWPDKPNYIHIHGPEYFESLVSAGEATWDDIEREFGCSFAAGLKGSFYSDLLERAKAEGRIGQFEYNSNYKVHTGWDLGVDDQTVVWFYQNIGNTRVYIDYHKWTKPESASGYVDFLANKPYRYDTHNLPHDAANRRVGQHRVVSTLDLFEECAKNIPGMTGQFNIVEKPGNKQHAIDLVRTQLPLAYFNKERCSQGLLHLELYHRKYDKARKTFIVDPVHDEHSHTADAFQSCALAEAEADNHFYVENGGTALDDFDVFD